MTPLSRVFAGHTIDFFPEGLNVFFCEEVVKSDISILQYGLDVSSFDGVFGQRGQVFKVEEVEEVVYFWHDDIVFPGVCMS